MQNEKLQTKCKFLLESEQKISWALSNDHRKQKKNKSPTIMTTNIFGRCHSCLVQRRRAQRFKMSSFNLSPGTKVLLASDQLSWVGGEQLRTMSRLVKNWYQFDIAKVVNSTNTHLYICLSGPPFALCHPRFSFICAGRDLSLTGSQIQYGRVRMYWRHCWKLLFYLCFQHHSCHPCGEQVPSVILTAVPGPIIGGLALAGFGTSLALQVAIVDYWNF